MGSYPSSTSFSQTTRMLSSTARSRSLECATLDPSTIASRLPAPWLILLLLLVIPARCGFSRGRRGSRKADAREGSGEALGEPPGGVVDGGGGKIVAAVPPADLLRLVRRVEKTLRLLREDGAIPAAVHDEERPPLQLADGAQRVHHRARERGEGEAAGEVAPGGDDHRPHRLL